MLWTAKLFKASLRLSALAKEYFLQPNPIKLTKDVCIKVLNLTSRRTKLTQLGIVNLSLRRVISHRVASHLHLSEPAAMYREADFHIQGHSPLLIWSIVTL